MQQISSSRKTIEIPGNVLLAMVAGGSLGIFIHGYWLIDLFPVDSKRLFLSTALLSIVGMGGYFLLFRWMRSGMSALSRIQRAGLLGMGILMGIYLFFSSTDRWQQPGRYVSLFLPVHTLRVSIPSGQDPSGISLTWFNTSLGDVSYDDMEYEGWKREDDQLALTNYSDNRLRWTGATGEMARIVFQSSSGQIGNVIISWDGQEEVLSIPGTTYTYQRSFDIPYFASRSFILLIGSIHFILLSIPLCLLVWKKRSAMLRILDRELVESPERFGKQEWLLLSGIIALALLLRIPNLENIFPGVDEYYQLNAARQILQGASLESVYQRGLWMVTIPSYLAFRVFGAEIWAARLVGAIFNALAIIPLYLVARRINRTVAILSVLLFATSPWVITFARLVREYAYYPFFYFWIVLGMILFLEGIPDRLHLYRDWKALLKPSLWLLGLGLALPPLYALHVDTLSTFKLILIAYGVFGVFIFLKMDLKDRKNLFLLLSVAGLVLLSGFKWFAGYRLGLTFNSIPLGYFFPNPPQQWYFGRLALIPAAGLAGSIVASFMLRRVNRLPLFLLFLFGSFLAFFVFSSNNFIGTRHLSTTNLWFVMLAAFGLYVIWVFLRALPFPGEGAARYLTIFVLGASCINIQQSLLPATSSDPYMSISRDYHYDLKDVHEYMLAHVEAGDALIYTVYDLYAIWKGEPKFRATHHFDIEMPREDVFSLIRQYDSGWMIIDTIILKMIPYPPFETFSERNGIQYVGLFGDQHVWHWRKSPGAKDRPMQGKIE
jgi:hypothetical protein